MHNETPAFQSASHAWPMNCSSNGALVNTNQHQPIACWLQLFSVACRRPQLTMHYSMKNHQNGCRSYSTICHAVYYLWMKCILLVMYLQSWCSSSPIWRLHHSLQPTAEVNIVCLVPSCTQHISVVKLLKKGPALGSLLLQAHCSSPPEQPYHYVLQM